MGRYFCAHGNNTSHVNEVPTESKLQSFTICLNSGVLKFALERTHTCRGSLRRNRKQKVDDLDHNKRACFHHVAKNMLSETCKQYNSELPENL